MGSQDCRRCDFVFWRGDERVHLSSCGRDAGTSDICPHCGADLVRRRRIRALGTVAIVVALGLALLLFFATRTPVPHLKIDQIQPNANYAYAQIDGVVTRGPNYNSDSQSLTFWVRDDTGEMMVSAFRDQTSVLLKADRLPAPGDVVSIQGTVRVRVNVPALTIDSADALQLTPYVSYTHNIAFSLANNGDEVLLLGPADQLVDGVAWGTGSLPGNVSCVAIDPTQYPLSNPSIARSPLWKDLDNCPNDFVIDTTALP